LIRMTRHSFALKHPAGRLARIANSRPPL
jgi:hypothetical protein